MKNDEYLKKKNLGGGGTLDGLKTVRQLENEKENEKI